MAPVNQPSQAAQGHMPFPGHRTQKEVREAEEVRLYGPLPEWCPEPYRDLYYDLQRKCGFTVGDSRRLIEAQIAVDGRRSAAA